MNLLCGFKKVQFENCKVPLYFFTCCYVFSTHASLMSLGARLQKWLSPRQLCANSSTEQTQHPTDCQDSVQGVTLTFTCQCETCYRTGIITDNLGLKRYLRLSLTLVVWCQYVWTAV